MQDEQLLHDRVNLARLVRRLEKTVSDETWVAEVAESSPTPPWIATRQTLQKVKHARKLLQSVESNEDASDSSVYSNPSFFMFVTLPSSRFSSQRYADYRKTLDRLERLVAEADKRYSPKPSRPDPILPSLPTPSAATEVPLVEIVGELEDPSTTLLPVEPSPSIVSHELLLSPPAPDTPRGPINPSDTLLPPPLPASTEQSATKATPAFLQNSAALHEELSAQLAQMATQLKRNAVHFADALDKDKAVVLEAQEKLERNHDVMSKERVRLRDHHSKSWGTTWITMLSIVVALIGFLLTFFVIRFT
ncbi:hypothetical protein C8Q77DRAFT_1157708 [Trametes polyzona]|nr:hypothetical protein C8Q77DRAFT_1157708 [Trametes polyzona]